MPMFGHDFYHGTLRRYVIMFGNLFNEIQIKRFDDSGNKVQTVQVPIAYGPKQRFIERALVDPTGLKSVSITLPTIGFAMNSMTYAPQRKLNSSLKYKTNFSGNEEKFSSVFAPVPYDLNFSLFVMTRNSEDGIQIIEQIVPFFTPDFTVTMKALPEMGVNLDIPIELTSITSDDQYEGDFETKRVLTWELEFIVKGYLFGPVKKTPYISNAEVSTFELNISDLTTQALTTQTFTGNSQFTITETITP
jgi:hypothetical protein